MKNCSIKKFVFIILIFSMGIINVNAQSIRKLFDDYKGKSIKLVYNNSKDGANGESTIELYFTDSKNLILFKLFDTYCLKVNFTEGYIVPNSFNFDEFEIIEYGAKIYAFITIENNEIIIKPIKNKDLEIRIKIKET